MYASLPRSIVSLRRRYAAITGLVAVLVFAGACPASAETFSVKATELCPGYFTVRSTSSGDSVTVLDPRLHESSNTITELMPCPAIKVEARDADPLRDDHCGTGYTNLAGEVEFRASCGDPWVARPDTRG